MKLRIYQSFRGNLALLLAAGVTLSAPAANIVWTNTAGGVWKTAANWNPNKVPGGNDTAIITNDGAYTITVNANASVGNLTLGNAGAGTPKLSITAGTFNVKTNGLVAVQSGAVFELGGGIFDGDGSLNVAGTMNWTRGEVRTFVHLTPEGQLNLSANNFKWLSTGIIDNEGTVTWSGSGAFQWAGGTALTNRGLFVLQNDLGITCTNSAPRPVFINQGTLRKTTTTGASTFDDVRFQNSGTLDVQSGTISFTGKDHSFSDGSVISGSGSVQVAGATVTLSGNVAASTAVQVSAGKLKGNYTLNGDLLVNGGQTEGNINLNGSLTLAAGKDVSISSVSGNLNVSGGQADGTTSVAGDLNLSAGSVTGDITVNGNLNWSGGALPGNNVVVKGDLVWSGGTLSGRIIVPAGHQLLIPTGANGLLDGGTITNYGTVTVTATESLNTTGNAFLYNYGLLLVSEGDPLTGDGSANTKVYNLGTLRKTGATTTRFKSVTVNSAGTIDVQDGALTFEGVKVHILSSGSQIIGAGRFMLDGATITLAAGVSCQGAFELASGTLIAAGAFDGNLTWSGGALSGTLTVPATRQMHITGNATKTMNRDAVINNQGQVLMDGGGDLKFFANTSVNNSGTLEVQTVNCFSFNGSDKAWFNNTGTLRKTVSTSALVFSALQLVNNGTIHLQAGDLSFTANTHTFTDGSVVLGPGSAHVDGATLSLGGAVSFGSPLYLGSGILSGNTTVATTLIVSGGQIPGNISVNGPVNFSGGEVTGTLTAMQTMDWSGGAVSGTLAIAANASLTVRSGGTRTLTGVLNNAGSVTVLASAPIILNNGTPIINSGLFEVQDDQPFKPTGSNKANFNNTGTFRKTTSIKTLPLSFVIFQNSGTLDVQAGALEFMANGHTFANGTRLTGSGPIRINGATVTLAGTVAFTGPVELTAGILQGTAIINGNLAWSGGTIPSGAGAGVFTINGNLAWSGGTLNGTLTENGIVNWSGGLLDGTVTIPVASRMNVLPPGNASISGLLQNAGTVVVSNNASILLLGGTPIVNSGVFEMQNEQALKPDGTTKVNLINSGTLRKTISTKLMKLEYVLLQNSGTLDVQTGEISLALNTHNFTDGTRTTGSGAVRVTGATLNVAGNFTLGPPLALDSGTMAGSATLNGPFQCNGGEVSDMLMVNGVFSWTGGLLKGGIGVQGAASWTGGEIDGWLSIATNSSLAIGGAATKSIKGGTLINNGLVTVTSPVTIQADGSAVIQNFGGFNVPVGLAVTTPWGGKPTFNNYGALSLTNGSGVFNFPGKLLQFPSGLLELELAGRSAGTNFSQITGVPNLTLDGTLAVRTIGGFEPALGDRFEIIKCDNRVGTFAGYVANTPRLTPDYSATNVTLFAAAPVLTNQPVSQTIGDGTSVTFSAGAFGSQPMSYQWLWNGAPVAGATNTALTFTNVHVDREGSYAVTVSNFWGSVTSTPAALKVILAPSITRQPQSLTVNQSNDAIFLVEVSGTHLSYRWKVESNWLPSATNATLWLTNVTTANAGKYKVEVSNPGGTVVSAEVILTVIIPPTVIEQPVGKNLNLGSGVTLSVRASGTTPFSYQWLKNGNAISNANQSSFSIAHMSRADEGSYVVIVANPAGYATSLPAVLLVNTPPAITTQPVSQTVNRGSNVVFSVTATGVPAPTYKWRLNGVIIPGATQPTLLLTNVQPGQSGNYDVSVVNQFGAVESLTAHLDVVTPLLSFSDNFADRGIIYTTNGVGHGSNCGATKEAGEPTHAGKGSANKSVWLSWWAPANGIATFSTLGSDFDTVLAVYRGTNVTALTRVAADDDSAGFHCSTVSFNAQAGMYYQIAVAGVGGTCGNVLLSWDLLVTSELLPQITQAPQDYTGNTNENTVVQVLFDAFEPTAIQWFFQGQLLVGATNTTLSITNLQDDMVGGYAVRLTAASGRTVVSPPGDIQINTEGRHYVKAMNKFSDGIIFILARGGAALPSAGMAEGPGIAEGPTPQRGFSGTQIFSTVGFDKDQGEPDHCGEPGGASSWLFLQAPTDGWISLDTEGSSFDTVLAVYTSTNMQLDSLVSVTCDDNSGADGRSSKVLFPASALTVYLIAVDGVDGVSGKVKLHYAFGTPPLVSENPASRTAPAGGTASFSVGVEADPGPVSYQWQFQGADLPFATNAVLTVTNVQPSATGAYCVRAWNQLGSVTSATAQLMLEGPLRLSMAKPEGNGTGFQLQVAGSANTRYVLEYSDDLKHWTPLATNLTTTGLWDFVDTTATNSAIRFYRAAQSP